MNEASRTPVSGFSVRIRERRHNLWLKLEGESRFGSVKSRTAFALVAALEDSGRLKAGGRVVESTSGNLGVALAGICADRGYRCTLVIDRFAPASSVAQMSAYGAHLIRVAGSGGCSLVEARLALVAQILAADPDILWTNQYGSPAGPRAHETTTGPELLSALGSHHADALFVPVSTGGTLAGVSRFARRSSPSTLIVAVDAVGSVALGGPARDRPEKLPGFGSARRSEFSADRLCDRVVHVSDREAASVCRRLHTEAGLMVGGSAGAAVAAAIRCASRDPSLVNIACLCPDGGDRYAQTIYADPTPPASEDATNSILAALSTIRREPELDSDDPRTKKEIAR